MSCGAQALHSICSSVILAPTASLPPRTSAQSDGWQVSHPLFQSQSQCCLNAGVARHTSSLRGAPRWPCWLGSDCCQVTWNKVTQRSEEMGEFSPGMQSAQPGIVLPFPCAWGWAELALRVILTEKCGLLGFWALGWEVSRQCVYALLVRHLFGTRNMISHKYHLRRYTCWGDLTQNPAELPLQGQRSNLLSKEPSGT